MAVAAAAAVAGLVLSPAGTALATASAASTAGPDPACPWVGSKAPVDTRTAEVVAKMTLDEKIAMVHGGATAGYTGEVAGDSRLCIPALKMQDGPTGVRMDDTTQLPAAADVAASFDTSVAKTYGSVIGAEDKAKGVDVDLGPTINIVRDPRWGRAFESYSEDPYLAGEMGAADIDGIQGQGVMAQVKHWAVYNQETNRNNPADNVVIDDRTVHEIYTSAFGRVVAESEPSSAMCSYSTVNGTYACENAYLDGILKGDFGFKGFITSDWGGTHSTVASANAGMDMQMPDDQFFGTALKTAVQDGKVPQSRVDDMVTRILREQFRFGLFDHPSLDTPGAVASTPAHVAVAKDAAEAGTVLLKNAGGVLPLDTRTAKSIAVIGDGAGPDTLTAGGGSATVAGTGTVTPYEGIKARAGSAATVTYAQGSQSSSGALPAIDSSYLTPPSGTGHGLQGDYYTNTTLAGTPAVTQTDPQVAFNWNGGSPATGVDGGSFSAKWTGTITPPATGSYTFGLTSDDGSRLLLDGKQVIDNWRDQAAHTETAAVDLTAGTPVEVEVDYYQGGGGSTVNLGWTPPGDTGTPIEQAVALAAKSDVAVVYANDYESEGSDLTGIDLPGDQNQLISAVAAVNPDTVVVLNTGSAVTMPWLDQVKGVLEAWYPGQQAGNAIADLLFGDTDPSGKLPVTFPASLSQVPASTAAQWPGAGGTVQYSEGLDVGYRWYDSKSLTPLFPFGYGLSYTSFAFSHLQVGSRLNENGTVSAERRRDQHRQPRRSRGRPALPDRPGRGGGAGPPAQGLPEGRAEAAPDQAGALRDRRAGRVVLEHRRAGVDAHAGDVHRPGRRLLAAPAAVRQLRGDPDGRPALHQGRRAGHGGRGSHAVGADHVHQRLDAGRAPGGREAGGARGLVGHGRHRRRLPQRAGRRVGDHHLAGAGARRRPGRRGQAHRARPHYQGSHGLPPGTGTATVKIAYAGLAAAYDTVGVSDDADQAAGNLDGVGYSFSAQSLASVGVTPGATVTSGSASFTWPDVPAGRPDAVTTAGQVISLSGTGSSLSLLTVGTNGTQSGDVTVTYTDGTTSTSKVTVADWYSNAAVDGCTLVVTSPHWNRPPGSTDPADHQVSLYAAAVPLTSGKQISSVTLPSNPQLHVFATSVG